MTIFMMCPRKLNTKEMGDLPHKINVTNGRQRLFKETFHTITAAKINYIININPYIDRWVVLLQLVCQQTNKVMYQMILIPLPLGENSISQTTT